MSEQSSSHFEHDAFISYRRSDGAAAARWLRRALLRYRLPKNLRATSPKRLSVYLDTIYEKATEDFFEKNIKPSLEHSRYLIVIVTPDSLKQRDDGKPNWVEREIETFRQTPQGRNIMVARVKGEVDDPLPGNLAQLFPNIEIVKLHDFSLLRFLWWPRLWRLRDELVKFIAPLFEVVESEMPILRREERNRRLKLAWGISAFSLIVVAVMTTLAGLAYRSYLNAEKSRKAEHEAQVNTLLNSGPQSVMDIIKGLTPLQADVLLRLRQTWNQEEQPETHTQRLRAGLALLALSPEDANTVKVQVYEWMLRSNDPQEMLLLRDALLAHQSELKENLWAKVHTTQTPADERFRACVMLAAFDPHSERWQDVGDQVVERLVDANPLHLGLFTRALYPVRNSLIGPLADVFNGRKNSDKRNVAASILAEYAADQTDTLVELIKHSDVDQFKRIFPLLKLDPHRDRAIEVMSQELAKRSPQREMNGGSDKESVNNSSAKEQAQTAVVLLQLGRSDLVWPLLRHTADPSLRSYLIHLIAPLGTDPEILIRQLKAETDISAQRALILSLGEFTDEQLSTENRQSVIPLLLKWYFYNPDPGIHGAIDWLLRNNKQGELSRKLDWQQEANLKKVDQSLMAQRLTTRNWYVTKEGQTMTVIRGPVTSLMSSRVQGEEDKLFKKQIKRSFAISTKEITVDQFKRFLKDVTKSKGVLSNEIDAAFDVIKEFSPNDDTPMLAVSWYQAALYCNWLSRQERLPECYIFRLDNNVNLAEDYLTRPCYRLPTESEWEYSTRAGATTSRFYGSSETLLKEYAWTLYTSDDRTWPVGQLKPNDLGLFDVYGNAVEWVQDRVGRGYLGNQIQDPFNLARQMASDDDVEDQYLEVSDDTDRILRGGSFSDRKSLMRSGDRTFMSPRSRLVQFGFRVARTLKS